MGLKISQSDNYVPVPGALGLAQEKRNRELLFCTLGPSLLGASMHHAYQPVFRYRSYRPLEDLCSARIERRAARSLCALSHYAE
jgi:hypothetical protein